MQLAFLRFKEHMCHHYLGNIILVAGIIVVVYVCMVHNETFSTQLSLYVYIHHPTINKVFSWLIDFKDLVC